MPSSALEWVLIFLLLLAGGVTVYLLSSRSRLQAELRKALQDAVHGRTEFRRIQEEQSQLEDRLRSTEEEHHRVERQRALLEKSVHVLEGKRKRLQQELSSAKEQRNIAETRRLDREADFQRLQAEQSQLEHRLRHAEQELLRMEGECGLLEEKVRVLEGERIRLEHDLSTTKEQGDRAESGRLHRETDFQRLQAEHSRLEERLRHTEQERLQVESDRALLEEKFRVLEGERIALEHELSSAKEQRDMAERRCLHLEADLQQLQTERSQLEHRLRHGEQEFLRVESDRASLEEKIRVLEGERIRLQHELSSSEEQRDRAERKSLQLEDALRQLRAEPGKLRQGGGAGPTEQIPDVPLPPPPPPLETRPEDGRSRPIEERPAQRPTTPEPPRPPAARRPKAEVVCWQSSRQWVLAVELPEELLEKPGLRVLQVQSHLSWDQSREDCWPLKNLKDEISVQWDNEEPDRSITISAASGGNYLLFKLGGQDQRQGRRVKSTSSGWYLVIAPETWERDEERSGPAPISPQSVSISGYKAYFFLLEGDHHGRIAFRSPRLLIPPGAPRFELVGARLNDASDDRGPLFGGEPPRVRALEDEAWDPIKAMVVGEEGRGRGTWRMPFKPEPQGLEQEFPGELGHRRGGWYFVRFYDAAEELLDSLEFRFLNGLREIRLSQAFPVPSRGQHEAVRVEFLHDPACSVRRADSPDGTCQINRETDRTIATISPDATLDQTRWLVGYEGGPEVEVTIEAQRVWWALGDEGNPPSHWTDQQLTLRMSHFNATTSHAVWLRVPRARWLHRILFGFDPDSARPYRMKITDPTIAFPLRELGDSPHLRRGGAIPLKVWLFRGENPLEAIIGTVIIELACKLCEFTTLDPEQARSHLFCGHLDQLFRELTFDEHRDRDQSLPSAIYQCLDPDCELYVKSDDPRNPTSTICDHIETVHRTHIHFRIVTDPEEIRQHVIRTLPRSYRCQICRKILDNPTQSDMMQHLTRNHGDDYIRILELT